MWPLHWDTPSHAQTLAPTHSTTPKGSSLLQNSCADAPSLMSRSKNQAVFWLLVSIALLLKVPGIEWFADFPGRQNNTVVKRDDRLRHNWFYILALLLRVLWLESSEGLAHWLPQGAYDKIMTVTSILTLHHLGTSVCNIWFTSPRTSDLFLAVSKSPHFLFPKVSHC